MRWNTESNIKLALWFKLLICCIKIVSGLGNCGIWHKYDVVLDVHWRYYLVLCQSHSSRTIKEALGSIFSGILTIPNLVLQDNLCKLINFLIKSPAHTIHRCALSVSTEARVLGFCAAIFLFSVYFAHLLYMFVFMIFILFVDFEDRNGDRTTKARYWRNKGRSVWRRWRVRGVRNWSRYFIFLISFLWSQIVNWF